MHWIFCLKGSGSSWGVRIRNSSQTNVEERPRQKDSLQHGCSGEFGLRARCLGFVRDLLALKVSDKACKGSTCQDLGTRKTT